MQNYSQIIYDLYKSDIDERNNLDWNDESQIIQLDIHDLDRRNIIRRLIKQNKLNAALDFHHAALILQHGDSVSDYKLSNKLAKKAVEMGDDSAKWLYAASFDRYLVSRNLPQKYGTQFKRNSSGIYELVEPLDPNVTDEERAKWNCPALKDIVKSYKVGNKTID